MKYLIIGTGGTGGSISSLLAKAGRDVTVIARGKHLEELQSKGLTIEKASGGFTVFPKATDMEHYTDKPDVIFVCVKGYSLESTIPFIRKVASENTVVVPILNIYGTGGRMQERLAGTYVVDACIYVSATIKAPGIIEMYGDMIRVCLGARTKAQYRPVLKEIADDMTACGIKTIDSDNIQRDTMEKYAFISPLGATALYFSCPIGEIQKPGEIRDCYISLTDELLAISAALGIAFERDILQAGLRSVDHMAPDATVSILRDVMAGHEAEVDGQIFHVVRMGRQLSVPTPTYDKVAAKLGFKE